MNIEDVFSLSFTTGVHHQYLGRPLYRIPYNLSAGLFLSGWLSDIIRVKCLVRQCNAEIDLLRSGVSMADMKRQDIWDCSLTQAYMFGCTLGIFGAHRFYLGQYKYGFLYAFTLGFLLVGWIYDLVRMKTLVDTANQERKTGTE